MAVMAVSVAKNELVVLTGTNEESRLRLFIDRWRVTSDMFTSPQQWAGAMDNFHKPNEIRL